MIPRSRTFAFLFGFCMLAACGDGVLADDAEKQPGRWTPGRAMKWHAEQPWMVGCNFIPSSAINQLEMWQAETFDPKTIDRELGWAASLGFNSVRVFLHDILWREDAAGYFRRIDQYLEIAGRHGIGTMFVLFDGCWDPHPKPGPQRMPSPGVHNSGWVQSPGADILGDAVKTEGLKDYVTAVISRYKNDRRVQVWDLFNEPDNPNKMYRKTELKEKDMAAARLVEKSFAWAREVAPSQPLTVCVWGDSPWDDVTKLKKVQCLALEQSDIISFHGYDDSNATELRIKELHSYGRPLLCTEYLARGYKSTFEAILPVLKRHRVAAYNWGLVDGKTQTKYPWETWKTPGKGDPMPWHHEIFRTNGDPYSEQEIRLLRELTGSRK